MEWGTNWSKHGNPLCTVFPLFNQPPVYFSERILGAKCRKYGKKAENACTPFSCLHVCSYHDSCAIKQSSFYRRTDYVSHKQHKVLSDPHETTEKRSNQLKATKTTTNALLFIILCKISVTYQGSWHIIGFPEEAIDDQTCNHDQITGGMEARQT